MNLRGDRLKVVELFLQLEKKDMFTIGVSLLNIITTILLVFVNQYYLKKNKKEEEKKRVFGTFYRPIMGELQQIVSIWSFAIKENEDFNPYNPKNNQEKVFVDEIIRKLKRYVEFYEAKSGENLQKEIDRSLYSVSIRAQNMIIYYNGTRQAKQDGFGEDNKLSIDDLNGLVKKIDQFWDSLY